jgi:futalosine hydrolase
MLELLIVAATDRELCGREGLVCGIGPVEAAASVARALALHTPRALLHVGVAGARGLPPGTLVVGFEAVYCDLAAEVPVIARAEPDPRLLAAARAALPAASVLPIGTSAAVGGSERSALAVEAMEGFAVLRAAALAGVAAVEVRAVSNELGERDRARWRMAEALGALERVLPRLVEALSKPFPA